MSRSNDDIFLLFAEYIVLLTLLLLLLLLLLIALTATLECLANRVCESSLLSALSFPLSIWRITLA